MTQTRHAPLPRGRHAAPRAVVEEDQRERLLEAMADVVAEKGYARVAVADVINRAGVSRKSFYALYPNKEACFLAAYDEGVERQLAAMREAMDAAGDDLLAVARAGTRRYLEMFAEHPSFARTFLVEVFAAGPPAVARRDAVHARFADLIASAHARIRAGAPELPEIPEHVFRAVVGAVNELVTTALVADGAAALPALTDRVLEFQLAVLLGYGPARAARGG